MLRCMFSNNWYAWSWGGTDNTEGAWYYQPTAECYFLHNPPAEDMVMPIDLRFADRDNRTYELPPDWNVVGITVFRKEVAHLQRDKLLAMLVDVESCEPQSSRLRVAPPPRSKRSQRACSIARGAYALPESSKGLCSSAVDLEGSTIEQLHFDNIRREPPGGHQITYPTVCHGLHRRLCKPRVDR